MKFIFSLLLVTVLRGAFAQPILPDSVFYSRSVAGATEAYRKEVRENLHIYNGAAYLRTGHGIKGTPFFAADSLLPGAAFYDNHLYGNLLLQYDMVADQVIIGNYAQQNQLQLVPEKLAWFSLAQHVFVRIAADSSLPSFMATGFYERLYWGNMTVLARHQKIPRQAVSAAENEGHYETYHSYFVLLNDVFYQVSGKSDFLSLMGSAKEAAARYIRENNINFKKEKEAAMVRMAAWYTQLKQ